MRVNPAPPSHAQHDGLLVAAHAAGDVGGDELRAARELVATCPECARLFDDLRLIQTATAAIPTVPRTRDFRLTAADAGRLRGRGWRRLLAPLRSPRFAFAGPVGVGLATLGIVGLLVASVPGVLTTSSALSTVGGSVNSEGLQERAAAPASSTYGAMSGAAGVSAAPSAASSAGMPAGSEPLTMGAPTPVAPLQAGPSASAALGPAGSATPTEASGAAPALGAASASPAATTGTSEAGGVPTAGPSVAADAVASPGPKVPSPATPMAEPTSTGVPVLVVASIGLLLVGLLLVGLRLWAGRLGRP